jgi:hypothetical protein
MLGSDALYGQQLANRVIEAGSEGPDNLANDDAQGEREERRFHAKDLAIIYLTHQAA